MTETREELIELVRELRRQNAEFALCIKQQAAEIAALRAQLAKALGISPHAPSTPSGQKPPYLKANASAKTKQPGRPGAKAGHAGAARQQPDRIDRVEEHKLTSCPHCDGAVSAIRNPDFSHQCRSRTIEDVVREASEVVRHDVRQYWCGSCKKTVEPAVKAGFPGARIGVRTVVQTAIQHYLMGVTISKVVKLLKEEHGLIVTEGGITNAWLRLADMLQPLYDEILARIRVQGVLHADETGWRVNGDTHWLWCFCTKKEVVYLIEKSRAGTVATFVLGNAYGGVLIRDFYAAYNACHAKETQFCLAHLLRALKDVEIRSAGQMTPEFKQFKRRVASTLKAAIRFHRKIPFDATCREAARVRFELRLLKVLQEPHVDPDARRLTARMFRSAHGLFTFLTVPNVDPTNNWAELNIRPAVIIRKNTQGNRSDDGADAQAVLMSVFRTLELGGDNVHDAVMRIVEATIVKQHAEKHTPVASDA